ncbi:MAG: beta-N-acetylglucosaminidase domain-containing protein [Gammaproteobacteria bacterium]
MKTGYIEGYYGKQLSFDDRKKLILFLANLGMTHYFYCPKEDSKHRIHWKEDYAQSFLDDFASLNQLAKANNIEIIFGLSPGNDFVFKKDYQILLNKFKQFIELGVSSICVLFDDLFESNRGNNHKDILNQLANDLDLVNLYTVPQIYCDQLSIKKNIFQDEYLSEFLENLNTRVNIFFTGQRVVSKTYPIEYLNKLKAFIGDRELLIWDNYFANDYCTPKVHFSDFFGLEDQSQKFIDGMMINATGSIALDQIYLKFFAAKFNNSITKEEILASLNLPREFFNILHLFEFEITNSSPERDLENIEGLLWRWNDPLKIEMYTYLHQLRQLLQMMQQDQSQIAILLKRFNFKRREINER